MRILLLVAALLCLPMVAEAQPLTDRPQSVSIGARIGYELAVTGGSLILGAATRAGVPGMERFEIQALADFTFLNALTERQVNLDVLYQLGGLAIGGGPAFRNTLWPGAGAERETRVGYSAVAIFGGQAGRSLLAAQLELRYSKVSVFSPRAIHLGVSLPLARF